MGNGATRKPVFGRDSLVCVAVPDRSPGPLGWQDAADPDELMCIAGDTPGPVGLGQDQACLLTDSPQAEVIEVPALEVDLDKVERFFYTVGLAEAQDFFAKRGFGSAEVELGRPSDVEARARLTAGRLMAEFEPVLSQGSIAVQGFLEKQEQVKKKASESLNRKFSDAQQAGSTQVKVLGGIIKLFAVVQFGSTVVRKVIGLHPGAKVAVTAIDIATDVTIEGVNAAFDQKKDVSVVVVSKTREESLKAFGEWLNEQVASGAMTRREQAEIESLFKNYRGDREELLKKIEKIEQRIAKAKPGSKTALKNARQYVKKMDKLGELNKKAGKTAMKGVAARGASLVFLAQDVGEAWDTLVTTWNQSN